MSGTSLTPARWLATLLAGALFGFGLALSTMIRPEVVLAPEDLAGDAATLERLAFWALPRLPGRPPMFPLPLAARLALTTPLAGPLQKQPATTRTLRSRLKLATPLLPTSTCWAVGPLKWLLPKTIFPIGLTMGK